MSKVSSYESVKIRWKRIQLLNIYSFQFQKDFSYIFECLKSNCVSRDVLLVSDVHENEHSL